VRRTFVLLGIVACAGLAVLVVDPPPRQAPGDQVRGPRVVKLRSTDVQGLTLALRDGRMAIARRGEHWDVDGQPSGERLAESIDDLIALLTTMRAVDRFRAPDDAAYGLDAPLGLIEVRGTLRETRLVLGALNHAGSAVYARRDGHPRVLLLGSHLLSAIDRVFYFRSRGRKPA